jgi:excisionase family DNA binding protein
VVSHSGKQPNPQIFRSSVFRKFRKFMRQKLCSSNLPESPRQRRQEMAFCLERGQIVLVQQDTGVIVDRLLTQKEVAHQLGISERTLERHRVTGTGPRWARLGRLVRYRVSDLEQWVEASLRTSTSDLKPRVLP